MSRLRWILGELCLCFCRVPAKIIPDLVLLLEVNLDLSRVAGNVLVLEFSPSAAFDESIIGSWKVICLTLACVERLLVLARFRHWNGVCRWFLKVIICGIRNKKPLIFNFNAFAKMSVSQELI